jgi:hypothetical protein
VERGAWSMEHGVFNISNMKFKCAGVVISAICHPRSTIFDPLPHTHTIR